MILSRSAFRLSRLRVGLAVAADSVRAIGVQDGRVLWAAEVPRHDQPLDAALLQLLSSAPVRGWPRPSVTVAVGPSSAQAKRVVGLPPLGDSRTLAQLVRGSVARIFLKNGIPLLTTGVRRVGDGAILAAAIEQPVVNAAVSSCGALGLRVRAVAPTVVVLGHAVDDERVTWVDGECAVELSLDGGRLCAVQRMILTVGGGNDSPPPRVAAALAHVGAEGWRFADAYGAAMLPHDEPLAIRPGRASREARPVPAWRLAIASGALALAAASALLAPGVAAERAGARISARLAELAPEFRGAAQATADLRQVTAALEEVAAFDSKRRSATRILADLTRALSDDVYLVTVRLDSAGGNVVALSSRASLVLAALERLDAVASPEIVGPLTRERVAGTERERATIRFRWSGASQRPASVPSSPGGTS